MHQAVRLGAGRRVAAAHVFGRRAASSSGGRCLLSTASTFSGTPPLSPFQPSTPAPTFSGPRQHSLAHEQQQHHQGQQPTPPPPPPAVATFSQRLRHSSYDITIVGGGMVGSTLALALASSPITRHLKVCIIETTPPRVHAPLQAAPSIRVSAVAPASAAFFERLGAWRLMHAKRVTPFNKMHVWHTQQHGQLDWDVQQLRGEATNPTKIDPEAPSSALGYIVENDVLQNSIWLRLMEIMQQQQSGALIDSTGAVEECNLEILSPAKIEQILPGQDGTDWPRLVLSNEQSISTRLLVGADGPTSLVKKFAGEAIDSFGWDYPQRAVVATLKLAETAHANDTAFQRFLPTGPIALLPCHDGYANLVWSTTPAHAKELSTALTPQEFCQRVNQAFRADSKDFQPGGRLFDGLLPSPLAQVASILFPPSSAASLPQVASVVGPRLGFPLRFIHASTYVAPRIALIGDAAHVMHPLAGQGVNLGFGDAETLLGVIENAVTSGLDLGALDSLQPYTTARWSHNARLMHGVDAIGRIFSINGGPIACARSIGMDLLSAVPAFKRHAAATAMGVTPTPVR